MVLTLDKDTICMGESVFAEVDVTSSSIYWNDGLHPGYHTDKGITLNYLGYDDPIKAYTTYKIKVSADSPFGCASPVNAEDSIVVAPAPKLTITPYIFWGFDCDSVPRNITVSTVWDTSGIAPVRPYQWYKNGALISGATDSFYTVNDTGTYKVTVGGSFGCNTYAEAIGLKRRCDGPGSGSTPTNVNCAGKKALLWVLSVNNCNGIILAKGSNTSPGSFSHSVWRGTDSLLELVSYTDTTARYRAKKAGVYNIWYNVWFNDGSSGLCNSLADTFVVDSFVASLVVTPQCAESLGHRYLLYQDRSTVLDPTETISSRAYAEWDRLGTTTAWYQVNPPLYTGLQDTITLPDMEGDPTLPAWKKFRLTVTTNRRTCNFDTFATVGPVPNAGFTFQDSTCQKDAAVYFNNTSLGINSCLWDFGDETANTQKNPYRVYEVPGTYTIKLKIADIWGCLDSIEHIVEIVTENLAGNVEISPDYPCEQTTSSALFKNSGISPAISFEWFDKTAKWIGSGSNPWIINKSGYYYSIVKDKYGCLLAAKGDTVLFVKSPAAFIYGDSVQCQNVDFTLSGYAGQVAGLTYEWYRNGSVISGATKPELLQNVSTAGTYYYQVVTTIPKPNGLGSCSDISDSFKVVINPTPTAPVIEYSVVDCDSYTLNLRVKTVESGIYNWSNGDNGISIDVHHGGPYQVIFTDVNGCVNKGKKQTVRNLKEYLWTFPTGCYSLCYTDTNIITGPIIPFSRWDYLQNGSSFTGSSGLVWDIDLNLRGPGIFQMYLNNDSCDVLSDTMDVDYDCQPGGPGASHKFENGIGDLKAMAALLQLAPNPATNSTIISYSYHSDHAGAQIEVYDVLGRLAFKKQLQDAKGSFELNLQNFAPGTYRVLLRQGGLLLQHSKLSVTH